jgi:hypothetical protein
VKILPRSPARQHIGPALHRQRQRTTSYTVDPGPWAWLGEHEPSARHAFAVEVVHAQDIADEDRRGCCELYAERFGRRGLLDALRYARRLAPLDAFMATALRNLARLAA